jgi:hypothetical protein
LPQHGGDDSSEEDDIDEEQGDDRPVIDLSKKKSDLEA